MNINELYRVEFDGWCEDFDAVFPLLEQAQAYADKKHEKFGCGVRVYRLVYAREEKAI